jgi:hypothetical protein
MRKTELIHQLRHRLREVLSDNRAGCMAEERGPWRNISLRDMCNFLIGALIGYMTLGW